MLKFFFLLISLAALADECPIPNDSLIMGYDAPFRQPLNCNLIDDSHRIFKEMSVLTDSQVPVFLSIGQYGSNAAFDFGYGLEIFQQIYFGGDERFGQPQFKLYFDNLSVIAHEYGHAIFADILYKNFPEFNVFYSFLRKNSSKHIDVSKRIAKWQLKPDGLAKSIALFKIKYDQLKASQEFTNYFKNPANSHLRVLAAPYHELFADLVAAYNSDTKNLISEALYIPRMHPQVENAVAARSFDQGAHFELNPLNSSDPHVFFYRVRQYIGDHLWPADPQAKKLKLKNIIQAILEDMHSNFSKNDYENIEARNRSLISRLENVR